MIKRHISDEFLHLLKEYPVVMLPGPRQAGRTTLVKNILFDYEYANLESPEVRQFAQDDPKAFLAQFNGPIILDEIQSLPELLIYIQAKFDERLLNVQFVLISSCKLTLHKSSSQSFAGRTEILYLYPFSIAELNDADIRMEKAEEYIYTGFLPRVYDQPQRPTPAYSNYYQTYIERDVRQLIHLKDVALFEKFMKLLAGCTGQIVNHSALANDVGVNQNTINNWLSILEALFVIFKLPPYFENFGKRAVKSPKCYFIDT